MLVRSIDHRDIPQRRLLITLPNSDGRPSSKRRRTVAQACSYARKPTPPSPGPVARLPVELLSRIFELAIDFGDDYETLQTMTAITTACHFWRRVAQGTPSLWRNVAFVPFSTSHDDFTAPLLLAGCDEFSQSTITRDSFHGVLPLRQLYRRIEVLSRSAKTLTDLMFDECSICKCRNCLRDRATRAYNESACYHHDNDAVVLMLHLISQAQNLERLYLNFDVGTAPHFNAALVPRVCFARPRYVQLRTLFYSSPSHPDVVRSLYAFMLQLTSGMERFSLKAGPQWYQWGWDALKRRARQLRYLQVLLLPVWPDRAGTLPDSIAFPSLEAVILYSQTPAWVPSMPWHQNRWFDMPKLRDIITFPAVAVKTLCPLVERAYMLVQTLNDLILLQEAIASWPRLRCLTVCIADSDEGFYDKAAQVLDEIMDILTPSLSGRVHAPELTHLRIVDSRTKRLPPLTHEWDLRPWRKAEVAAHFQRYHEPVSEKELRLSAALACDIEQLQRQRERLAAGEEAGPERGLMERMARPGLRFHRRVRGNCVPLTHVKVVRMP